MKILSCMFAINRGGIENNFIKYNDNLKELGYETAILANEKFEDLHRFQDDSIYTTKYRSKFNPITYIKILQVVNDFQPDIILLQGNRSIDIVCNKIIKMFMKNKKTKFLSRTHSFRNRRYLKTDYCLAITEDTKKDLIKRGFSKDRIFFCPNSTKLQEKTKDFSYHEVPVIGSLGRYHTVKGFDVLIKAFANLRSKGIDCRLVIGGDGAERDNLQNLIEELGVKEYVELKSWVADLEEFYQDVDIFCMSSRSEAFGLTLIEGMSFSKPCVITKCSGPMEIVSKYEDTALIAEKDDIDSLAECLEKVVINEDLGKEMSQKSYKTIQNFYSYETFKKNLKNAIETINKRK